ncbi:hypothetical protein NQ314_012760 [Rhamnusium bicolor]|uniref:Uncharacterized protein n=1 Tax=Rhamnusium bicolor TaxID=1586634 RepID=A0AAV8XAR9_9CUCU|nr:hypothetical protein NQ314_012760 [Rhamnusium bicolor]
MKMRWLQSEDLAYHHGGAAARRYKLAQDEEMVNWLRRNPCDLAVTACHETQFSALAWTARRRIKQSNISDSAARMTGLSDRHKKERLLFANNFIDKDDDFWLNIIFSAEKVFQSYYDGLLRDTDHEIPSLKKDVPRQ